MTKSHDLDCGHTHGQEEGEAPVAALPLAPAHAVTASPAWTAGPWRVFVPDSRHYHLISGNLDGEAGEKNGGIYVAQVNGPDHEANARLIAAAPDLAKALQFALEMLHADARDVEPHEFSACVEDAIREGEAALAKARGQ